MGDGLYKRGGIWWFRTDPLTRKAASSGKRDKTAALLERRRRERLAADPDYVSEDEKSLGDWIVRLLEQKTKHRAAATVRYYRQKLGHLTRIFGPQAPLSVLRPAKFEEYVAQRLGEGAVPSTVDKEIKAAQVLARYAARFGAFRGRPELFKPPDFSAEYEPRERFLPEEELHALLKVLSPKRAAHVALSVAVGPRLSESFRITREDVDLANWKVRVRGTKTKKSRDWVPIAEPFWPLLLAALPFLPLEPWSNMVRDLERACIRAGIAKVTANDLRRTHGTWLSELGVHDSLIGRALRHSDERMARLVYAKPRAEKVGEAIAAQIAITKTRQQVPDEVGTDAPKGQIVQVAQSVEQRTEKPTFRLGDWAEAIANPGETEGFGESESPSDAATFRRVRNKNATVLVPRLPERRRLEHLIEATNLAFDQERPGRLRARARARIEALLGELAASFTGAPAGEALH
jgi:integrase